MSTQDGDMGGTHLLQSSGTFQPAVIDDIQTKAATGLYRIRGWGTLRERRWATFDDLTTALPVLLSSIAFEQSDQIRQLLFRFPNSGQEMKMIRHQSEAAQTHVFQSLVAEETL